MGCCPQQHKNCESLRVLLFIIYKCESPKLWIGHQLRFVLCTFQAFSNDSMNPQTIEIRSENPIEKLLSKPPNRRGGDVAQKISSALIPHAFDLSRNQELGLNYKRYLPRLCELVSQRGSKSLVKMSLVGDICKELKINAGSR